LTGDAIDLDNATFAGAEAAAVLVLAAAFGNARYLRVVGVNEDVKLEN